MKIKELKTKRQNRKDRGITLIALVVTIVVLLILAAVSIAMLGGENGIITQAQKAQEENIHGKVKEAFILKQSEHTLKKTNGYEKDLIQYLKSIDGNNVLNENNEINISNLLGNNESLGNGNNKSDVYMVESKDEITYFLRYYDKKGESKDLLEFKINGDSTGNIDWDEIFENTTEPHPDQSETNKNIGLDENGKLVNMDNWYATSPDSETIKLGTVIGSEDYEEGHACNHQIRGYIGKLTAEGTIEGEMPAYVKLAGLDKGFLPVVDIEGAFIYFTGLKVAPQIPFTVENMNFTFFGCKELTTAINVPDNVKKMEGTFSICNKLTGNLEINAQNIIEYENCFAFAAVEEGTDLAITGTSPYIDRLISTAWESNIRNGNLTEN